MRQQRRITLELEVGTDPITGRAQDENGADMPFAGWLELAAVLERCSAEVPVTETED